MPALHTAHRFVPVAVLVWVVPQVSVIVCVYDLPEHTVPVEGPHAPPVQHRFVPATVCEDAGLDVGGVPAHPAGAAVTVPPCLTCRVEQEADAEGDHDPVAQWVHLERQVLVPVAVRERIVPQASVLVCVSEVLAHTLPVDGLHDVALPQHFVPVMVRFVAGLDPGGVPLQPDGERLRVRVRVAVCPLHTEAADGPVQVPVDHALQRWAQFRVPLTVLPDEGRDKEGVPVQPGGPAVTDRVWLTCCVEQVDEADGDQAPVVQ